MKQILAFKQSVTEILFKQNCIKKHSQTARDNANKQNCLFYKVIKYYNLLPEIKETTPIDESKILHIKQIYNLIFCKL